VAECNGVFSIVGPPFKPVFMGEFYLIFVSFDIITDRYVACLNHERDDPKIE
jgi:hypothetical protein